MAGFYEKADKEGYFKINNEYEQRRYVSFDRQNKEITVFGSKGQNTYTIGEMLIDFVIQDDGRYYWYEEDRLQLIHDLHRLTAEEFKWDYINKLSEFEENYLKKNNISLDEFAQKIAIYEQVYRYEEIHPYLSMIDLYTSIVPVDNKVLLNETLNINALREKVVEIFEFCFDVDTPYLNELPSDKRYYFYLASGRGGIPQNFKTRVIAMPDKINVENHEIFYKDLPDDFNLGEYWDLTSINDLRTPQDVTDKTIDYLKDYEIKLYEAYEINSFADIAYLEVYQMLLNRSAVKKCELCGRYFLIKGDYNAKYCDRKMEGKRQTCQQIGSSRDFNKRVEKSEPHKEYMKAYKRMHSRIKYGMITKEQFHEWNKQADGKLLMCESGELSLEDFKVWLGNK